MSSMPTPDKPSLFPISTIPFGHMDEPQLRDTMSKLAWLLEQALPPAAPGAPASRSGKPIFMLLVDDGPGAQYVGNLERPGAVAWLRETADRLEAGDNLPRDGRPPDSTMPRG